ncbi:MAG: hypothetical protein J6B87_06585 [Clostridia bacterium]|nr:hypothetical protein [Clostridia bacterium]
MKKTWKERLYDVSCSRFVTRHIPSLLLGVALLSIICYFVFGILFDWIILPTIFLYMFYFLPIIGFGLNILFDAVKSYNKETFCCNKIRNSLLANDSFVCLVLGWTLIIACVLIANIIFGVDSYGFRVMSASGTFLVLALSFVINKSISNHFKRKIIYIENENSKVKDN